MSDPCVDCKTDRARVCWMCAGIISMECKTEGDREGYCRAIEDAAKALETVIVLKDSENMGMIYIPDAIKIVKTLLLKGQAND